MSAKRKAVVDLARRAIGDLYILGLLSEAERDRAMRRWIKWVQRGGR